MSSNEIYLSNPLLKRAFVPVEYTADQVKEVMRCSRDIKYFIKTYVKIISLDHGLIPFDLYDFQENMVDNINDNRFTIIKTCRQAGKTTTSAAVILWHAIFNENYTIAILANKLSTAREILARVQKAYENLPKWLQQGIISWNKTNIELENGSQIMAASTASSAIRGFSINFLYLDEFAFVGRNVQDDFFTSVYPTIISGTKTKVVITSTPNGFDLFYKLWTNSVEGRNEYVNQSVNWWDVPGRDEEWKAKTIANTSEEQFRQEFEAEFIGSTNTLLSPNTLRSLVFHDPMGTNYEGALRIYKEPQPDHHYFCTVDTSRGVHLDASAFTVIDVTKVPYEVVAVYASNSIAPLLYPEIIYSVCSAFNNASTLVEINDNGQQVADILHFDLEYENVIFTSVKGRAGQVINGGDAKTVQKGVRTTKSVKSIGCANVKTMIENQKLVLNDYQVINELSTFIQRKASYAAEDGAHDDLVMCLVIFAWATNQTFFKDLTDTDFRAKLLEEKDRLISDATLPFFLVDDGLSPDEELINTKGFDNPSDRWLVQPQEDDYKKYW